MTTTQRSPRVTRSQAPSRATTSEEPMDQAPTEALQAETLQAILRELSQLRQEQKTERQLMQTELQKRDDTLKQLEREISQINQLSHPNNIPVTASANIRDAIPNENNSCATFNTGNLGFKLKPDTYDGTVPLREFFSQFELIARANRWDDETKNVALVSCLRGKARAVLECIDEVESFDYNDLKSKLELRFGEGHLSQSYYSLFTNRRQKAGEDEATLGSEIERLAKLAYPECSHHVRDKIACAQYISAVSNKFVRRTLQLEAITSLKVAIQRAMTIKVILENNAEERKEFGNKSYRSKSRNEDDERERPFIEVQKGKEDEKLKKQTINKYEKKKNFSRECWQCGSTGHFRAECPSLKSEGN